MTSHPEFNDKTTASEVAAAFPQEIKDKTILITGVSPNGLGQSTTEALATHNPRLLILTGRSQAKVQAVIDRLAESHPGIRCRYLELDLSRLASVRKAGQEIMSDPDIQHIDLVICNAGVMWIPQLQLTEDNIEMQFATNHVGHFLLVNLILEKLIAAAKSSPVGSVRVINVSSQGAMFSPVRFSDPNFTKEQEELPESERGNVKALEAFGMESGGRYNAYMAYGQSKSANILFSVALTNRLFKKHGIKSYALHPGGILTELWRHSDNDFVQKLVDSRKGVGGFKNLEQGSSTTLVAALDPNLPTPSPAGDNVYLEDCQLTEPVPWAKGFETWEKLWSLSETLAGGKFSV
jgi:NAD(P)-dependent dehydrogenase (short-subunit alcohol dehydrogenase family)